MAFSYGFFDSLNGDRLYDAEQFSSFFDGIIDPGVFSAIGDKFQVDPLEGMTVTVGAGRAWFDHVWVLNTTKLAYTLKDADPIGNRIDEIVLEINKNSRKAYIKVLEGSPTSGANVFPTRPSKIKNSMVTQYPLAYITIPPRTTLISNRNINIAGVTYKMITQMVDGALNSGPGETPLCSAINLAGIPSGGYKGYVLAKKSDESGAVGWYDVNKLPTADWMYPNGLEPEYVLAAYKFKGADSQDAALTNIVDKTKFKLSKDSGIEWTPGDGFRIPAGAINTALYNSDLNSQDIRAVAVKFANAETGTEKSVCLFSHNFGGAIRSLFVHPRVGLTYDDGTSATINNDDYGYPTIGTNKGLYIAKASQQNIMSGVLSANFVSSIMMYYNGESLSLTNRNVYVTASRRGVFGNIWVPNPTNPAASYYTLGSYYIHSAALYRVELTSAQHAQLTRMMNGEPN